MFWLAIIVTGVATGLFGDALMALLFNVEHLAFGYHSGSLLDGVRQASNLRRVVSLLIAGVFGAVAWYLLRRFMKGPTEVDDALWRGTGKLSFWRSLGTSAISEVVIGMGASIGREAAPKLMGGASGSVIAGWARLSSQQRRLLVSCGAGSGLAAVYNVPIGGALFTAEVLVGSVALPIILPALACSTIATQTARWYLADHQTYTGIPHYHSSARLLIWAILLGPLVGLVAAGYIRLARLGRASPGDGRRDLPFAMPLAFGVLGLLGIAYPALFGNGSAIVGRDLARQRRAHAAARAVPAQAAGDRDVPGGGRVRWPVHARAEHRRAVRRLSRARVDAPVARHAARRVRDGRRRGDGRRGDAGPARGAGDRHRADRQRPRADHADDRGDGHRDRDHPLPRRLLDLLGAAAGAPSTEPSPG